MNRYLTEFSTWLLTTSAMACVLILFILLIKFILKDRLRPNWTYFLWILLIVRLLLPWAPESSLSVFNVIPTQNQEISQGSMVLQTEHENSLANPNVERGNNRHVSESSDQASVSNDGALVVEGLTNELGQNSIMHALAWIWLTGALFIIGWMLTENIRFAQKVRKEPLLTDPDIQKVFDQCKNLLKVKSNMSIIRTKVVTSPTLFGVIHPKLLIPEPVLHALDKDQLKYLFLHELSHAKRNDIAINGVMNLLLALHWFNPLLWFAYHKMRDDQELACDASVLKYLNMQESKEYALTIITLLELFSRPIRLAGAASLSGNKRELKRRMVMIQSFQKYTLKSSVLGMIVILFLTGAVLTNAQTHDNPSTSSEPIKEDYQSVHEEEDKDNTMQDQLDQISVPALVSNWMVQLNNKF